MKWFDLIETCGTSQTINRALSALERRTIYKLGRGGIDPTKPLTSECDCSGFIAWAIGIPRELPPGSHNWLSTDEYWAEGRPVMAGMFSQIHIAEVRVGDLLVYPDNGNEQGHIGLVIQVHSLQMIHCSSGNFNHFGNAICTTSPAIFLSGNHNTRAMRINYDALKKMVQRLRASRPRTMDDGRQSTDHRPQTTATYGTAPANVAAVKRPRASTIGLAARGASKEVRPTPQSVRQSKEWAPKKVKSVNSPKAKPSQNKDGSNQTRSR
jgi:hypothetical protein